MNSNQYDNCGYYVYDEEYGEYVCEADMDKDDYARLFGEISYTGKPCTLCPFYRDGDKYKIAGRQM